MVYIGIFFDTSYVPKNATSVPSFLDLSGPVELGSPRPVSGRSKPIGYFIGHGQTLTELLAQSEVHHDLYRDLWSRPWSLGPDVGTPGPGPWRRYTVIPALRAGAWFPIVSLMKMQTFSLADNAVGATHLPVDAAHPRSVGSVGSLPPPPSHSEIWSLRSHIASFFSLTRKKASFSSSIISIHISLTTLMRATQWECEHDATCMQCTRDPPRACLGLDRMAGEPVMTRNQTVRE